jgi:hypothetical protein
MANQADVRRIALSLPGVGESEGRFAFSVENKGKPKGFVWSWAERVHPKKPRVPRKDVIAVRVRDQAEKAALLAGDPDVFFTEPHYNGFPAVLVRLPAVRAPLLRKLIVEAWRCQAPPALVQDGVKAPRGPAGTRPSPGRCEPAGRRRPAPGGSRSSPRSRGPARAP